jgi:hypothetical protein
LKIESLKQAIGMQSAINRFLSENGIKDLVGDYGELLVNRALGGSRAGAVNQGFDIIHPDFGRIEVKTRKYELQRDGRIRKEDRAVGFLNKEGGFDWLAHVVLNVDFSVEAACLVDYADIWPEITKTEGKNGKVAFARSIGCPSSQSITEEVRIAQRELGFGL